MQRLADFGISLLKVFSLSLSLSLSLILSLLFENGFFLLSKRGASTEMEVRPLTLSNARKGVKGRPGLSSSFFKLPFGWAPDVRRQLNCFVRSRSLSLCLSVSLSLQSGFPFSSSSSSSSSSTLLSLYEKSKKRKMRLKAARNARGYTMELLLVTEIFSCSLLSSLLFFFLFPRVFWISHECLKTLFSTL